MAKIAVLDYGIGNLRSAQKAFERSGADAYLTADEELVLASDGVVLPGVGNFGNCATALTDSGVREIAFAAVENKIPFLGICVGMQLLFDSSEESPEAKGLGLISGKVKLLVEAPKVPQMQWNQINLTNSSPLLEGLEGEWFYFVHSYALGQTEEQNIAIATCDYRSPVIAAVQKELVFGTQFHPEKSGKAGRLLLRNFISICENLI
ncbi:MAG: imidazole glycerol phosphate synthase subunit HisH [Acidimicrobiaceae bacterium]|jgi:glutamine amidotransferase|nr:imidazole glycerol phosphate synthase subunit HisH [Acidimicrobiaceae bacterium]|tara:strand:- start:94281 stop:94901 length:621 start_codon:yes stop_codon:yes gene_type:complete